MRIETYLLAEHGWVPNNVKLPVILYRQAMTPASCEEAAAAFEARFQQHGCCLLYTSPSPRDS